MAKSHPYFIKAKVSDRVRDTDKGDGEISFISRGKPTIVSVKFDKGGYWMYSLEGKDTDNSEQTLFYL